MVEKSEGNPPPIPWLRFADLLAKGGLSDEHIEMLMDAVATVTGQLNAPWRVFPRGIPPVTDGLTGEVILDAAGLQALTSALAGVDAAILGVEYFPYGIINPEAFVVSIDFA